MKGTKRITGGIGKVVLALLGAVFMPILIWVALGATVKRGVGKVVLALLGAIFMPILIWVALGTAVKQGTQRKATHTTREIPATT